MHLLGAGLLTPPECRICSARVPDPARVPDRRSPSLEECSESTNVLDARAHDVRAGDLRSGVRRGRETRAERGAFSMGFA